MKHRRSASSLLTSCSHVTCDEGAGEVGPATPQTAGPSPGVDDAFNTVQPRMLEQKLQTMGVDSDVTSWISVDERQKLGFQMKAGVHLVGQKPAGLRPRRTG